MARTAGLTAAVLLAALTAGAAAGQEPEPEQPRQPQEQERPELPQPAQNPQDTARTDAEPTDTVVAEQPPLGYVPPSFSLAVFAGVPGSGPGQSQPVQLWRRLLDGTVTDSATLNRAIAINGAYMGAVHGTLGLGRDWALRLGAGLATATLETEYSGDDQVLVASANAVAGSAVELQIVSLESALIFRIPSTRQLQPYVELGGALSRWTTDAAPSAGLPLTSGTTRFEALAGVGGVIPVGRRFSARLHAATRVFRTPVLTAPVGDTLATSSTLVLVSRPTSASAFADARRESTGLLRLLVGFSYDLGRPVSAPPAEPPPQAAPDTTPPPPG